MDQIFYILCILIFLIGLCIGSFLNCVIYRLEQKKKITGRSFCPHCNHKLSWQDLFPIFSFLFLGGKCGYCGKKISWQYPIIELATGAVFVFAFWILGSNWLLGDGIFGIAKILFIFYVLGSMIIIFVYDLKHYIIPDKVLIPAILIALVFRILDFYNWGLIVNYLFAAAAGFVFFYIIFFISKGQWMGFGDVKLAILMGILLGFPNIAVALFLAFFFGAIIGLIMIVFDKKSIKSQISFGPFMVLGTFLVLLWGQQLIDWYVRLFL